MVLILIGLVFSLLTVKLGLTVGESVVYLDVLPNFIGFILLFIGLNKMSNRVEAFAKAKVYVIMGLIFSLLEYLVFKSQSFLTVNLIPLISIVITLVVMNFINKGIGELELKTGLNLDGVKLLGLFNIILVVVAIHEVAGFIPNTFFMSIYSLTYLIEIILNIMYLILLGGTIKKLNDKGEL